VWRNRAFQALQTGNANFRDALILGEKLVLMFPTASATGGCGIKFSLCPSVRACVRGSAPGRMPTSNSLYSLRSFSFIERAKNYAWQIFTTYVTVGWLGSRVVSVLDSGAVGPGFRSQQRRCRVTVLGKLFTPIVPLFCSPNSEIGSSPLKGCEGNCGPGGK